MKATELYDQGYTDLVSIIPPNASLSPSSKIRPESRGKSPGIRRQSGLWTGYHWQDLAPLRAQAERMERDGANVGLRAGRYPAIDVDIRDEPVAEAVARIIENTIPTGPMRVGAWPKRLYPFRLEGEPFSRMQLFIEGNSGARHCVEILGDGQQYLVAGMHPIGKPYEWRVPLVPAAELPTITREQAEAVLAEIAEICELAGFKCERGGTGHITARGEVDQEALKAKDLDVLADAVAFIPNTNGTFPHRDHYIEFGYAVKAATQDDPGRGLEIFQDWCEKWEGNHNGPNRPEVVAADWERMEPPYSIGADYIFDLARKYGYDTSQHEFTFEPPPAAPEKKRATSRRLTDDWLTDKFVTEHQDSVRYIPEQEQWLVWNGTYWARSKDTPELIRLTCREVADQLSREGATAQEIKRNASRADSISSARQFEAVQRIARHDPRILAPVATLDADPNLLGTPAGIVDLRTGELLPPDPAKLITRCTAVAHKRSAAPLWYAFLKEATGNDRELESYLQRLTGYCLTGHTKEEVFAYVYGPGGRGKGTFLNTFAASLGSYLVNASMTTFTASDFDRHPTDMAALAGARMVLAQEVREGHAWDEQRIKQLTGGDEITARFLFQDFFSYKPTFKLVFSGNYRPRILNVDAAMRRRIHLIPFTHEPREKDLNLKEKLRANELPAVLAWAIDGCVAWQHEGLRPPQCVLDATEDYFRDEDVMGRWLDETCVLDSGECAVSELYQNWMGWCEKNNEASGSSKKFGAALANRGFKKRRNRTGNIVYIGVSLQSEFPVPVVQ